MEKYHKDDKAKNRITIKKEIMKNLNSIYQLFGYL